MAFKYFQPLNWKIEIFKISSIRYNCVTTETDRNIQILKLIQMIAARRTRLRPRPTISQMNFWALDLSLLASR